MASRSEARSGEWPLLVAVPVEVHAASGLPNDHLPRLGRFVGVGDCDEVAERHAADSTAWCLFGLEHDIGERDAIDVPGEMADLSTIRWVSFLSNQTFTRLPIRGG